MNMFTRLVAATGAVLLWAYARACRERNLTQRRLGRASLLRSVAARPPHHKVGSGDRTITVDITPDTSKLDSLRVWWSSPDDEFRRRFDAMAAEAACTRRQVERDEIRRRLVG